MKLRRGRFQFWLTTRLSNVPIPRPVWFFESTTVDVGAEIGTFSSDPVVSATVEIDLPPRVADLLADFLDRVLP